VPSAAAHDGHFLSSGWRRQASRRQVVATVAERYADGFIVMVEAALAEGLRSMKADLPRT